MNMELGRYGQADVGANDEVGVRRAPPCRTTRSRYASKASRARS